MSPAVPGRLEIIDSVFSACGASWKAKTGRDNPDGSIFPAMIAMFTQTDRSSHDVITSPPRLPNGPRCRERRRVWRVVGVSAPEHFGAKRSASRLTSAKTVSEISWDWRQTLHSRRTGPNSFFGRTPFKTAVYVAHPHKGGSRQVFWMLSSIEIVRQRPEKIHL